jgi:hypothetical protein
VRGGLSVASQARSPAAIAFCCPLHFACDWACMALFARMAVWRVRVWIYLYSWRARVAGIAWTPAFSLGARACLCIFAFGRVSDSCFACALVWLMVRAHLGDVWAACTTRLSPAWSLVLLILFKRPRSALHLLVLLHCLACLASFSSSSTTIWLS